jgi:hopanoid biosynthesis associated protein HpnK
MKVVFHADDFGLTRGVNEGIVEAYERGVLRSTSLMVTAPAFEDAVERAKRTPGLDVGVHLTLVEEAPALAPVQIPSLVRGARFWPTHTAVGLRWLTRRWQVDEACSELGAQLARFDDTGLVASHLDGHQHLHLLPGVFSWVTAQARRRGIRFVRDSLADPLRGGSPQRAALLMALRSVRWMAAVRANAADLRTLEPFATVGFLQAGGTLTAARLLAVLERFQRRRPEATVEVMLHPGRPDEEAQRRYGHWHYHWESDFKLLVDPSLPDELARRGIEVTSFRALAGAR